MSTTRLAAGAIVVGVLLTGCTVVLRMHEARGNPGRSLAENGPAVFATDVVAHGGVGVAPSPCRVLWTARRASRASARLSAAVGVDVQVESSASIVAASADASLTR